MPGRALPHGDTAHDKQAAERVIIALSNLRDHDLEMLAHWVGKDPSWVKRIIILLLESRKSRR